MLNRFSAVTVILLIVLACSCNFDKKEKCLKLDNTISSINDSLLRYGAEWGDELQIAISTLDFSGLQPIRVKMQDYIDRKIVYVKDMDNIGGSEQLLEVELEFLEVEEEIVANKLSVFERFTDSVSMDQLSTAYADMQLSAVKEQDLLKRIQTLREQYAEKNGFPKFIE